MNKQRIDLFKIIKLNYGNRSRCLNVESSGEVKSTKFFPVFTDEFGVEKIFKPLSKTKPLSTPLFAYSEVICSYLINRYFDNDAPIYKLAICKGITEANGKYHEKGTIVNSFLKENQKFVNLLEYFKNEPDEKVNINKYINYCMFLYDYRPIFNSSVFSNNENLSEQLANQVLLSILTKNQNFHYENVGFIYEEDKIISLAPPIDHEFSSIFLYADNKDLRDELNKKYDDFICYSGDSLMKKNISLIVKLHPKFCKKFIRNLNELIDYLEEGVIVMKNNNYIETFSSFDWRVWEALIKRGDSKTANKLEKTIKRVGINNKMFSDEIRQRFISSAKNLRDTIGYIIAFK